MGFKDTLEKERRELKSVKRPYETVAFIIFVLMIAQNLYFLILEFINLVKNSLFSVGNVLVQMNNATFIARFSNSFSNQWLSMIVGILLFALYWALIYYFVWNYSKNNKLAKWTWTLFVVYGPSIFLATPLVFFVIYVFRKYFARFAKRFVEEFKNFDPNHKFEEEKAEVYDEDAYDDYIKDESYSEEETAEEDEEKNK
ncbi:hypothetical protein KQ51_01854 [Candidatus Izimaplasma bacterium HR1]|uniref:hypothetical protein n=1 Tax=Candidatus Izimoplasma sp. HR1 TaxID=1541959 RepID=UPI0004F73164|nr:hypothetical protein KQ51_01854 [Candidatus Izimaplasma bacterium HR1]